NRTGNAENKQRRGSFFGTVKMLQSHVDSPSRCATVAARRDPRCRVAPGGQPQPMGLGLWGRRARGDAMPLLAHVPIAAIRQSTTRIQSARAKARAGEALAPANIR